MVPVSSDRGVNPLTRQMSKALLKNLDNFIAVTKEHIVKTKSQIAELEKVLAAKNIDSAEKVQQLKAPFNDKGEMNDSDVFKEIENITSLTKQKMEELQLPLGQNGCRPCADRRGSCGRPRPADAARRDRPWRLRRDSGSRHVNERGLLRRRLQRRLPL